uniref:7TM_GPCR_Srx domain-containing protein n=1 Tax=Parastrongyloides trichosuri TaxID=131310 RepID=A0A0N4ZDU1_PARTI
MCLKHKEFKKIKSYEIALFLQAVFNFLCIFTVQILWQLGDTWFPNSVYLYTYLNFVWLNVAGRDSVFNILLLREIRIPVLKFLTYKKSFTKVTPTMCSTNKPRIIMCKDKAQLRKQSLK